MRWWQAFRQLTHPRSGSFSLSESSLIVASFMKHMTLSVQMVRFSLSLSVAIFFSHKFSENNHRQRDCLLEIRTGCGILRGTLSLSLSDEEEPQAVYDKLFRNRCYKFAKRMIDGSIYRSIDRSVIVLLLLDFRFSRPCMNHPTWTHWATLGMPSDTANNM
jgi:hypothetical protein